MSGILPPLRSTNHSTPRMHQRPNDPAYFMLDAGPVTVQKVYRRGCFICRDREFARMGLPLCRLCCACAAAGNVGHISADDTFCDDCHHELCEVCVDLPPQPDICTCDTPCCEADVGIGIITCGSQHCPTHGGKRDAEPAGDTPVRDPDAGLSTEKIPGETSQA